MCLCQDIYQDVPYPNTLIFDDFYTPSKFKSKSPLKNLKGIQAGRRPFLSFLGKFLGDKPLKLRWWLPVHLSLWVAAGAGLMRAGKMLRALRVLRTLRLLRLAKLRQLLPRGRWVGSFGWVGGHGFIFTKSQMCYHTQNWAQLKTQLFKVVCIYIYVYT